MKPPDFYIFQPHLRRKGLAKNLPTQTTTSESFNNIPTYQSSTPSPQINILPIPISGNLWAHQTSHNSLQNSFHNNFNFNTIEMFLESIESEFVKYSQNLKDNGYSVNSLYLLNDQQLKEIGVDLCGHRTRILAALGKFNV